MTKQHEAAKGISYLSSGGKWLVAAAGELVSIDERQVKDALKRGVINEVSTPKVSPPSKKEVTNG
jgi:hypothetical protein